MSTKNMDDKLEDFEESSVDTESDSEINPKKKKEGNKDDDFDLDSDIDESIVSEKDDDSDEESDEDDSESIEINETDKNNTKPINKSVDILGNDIDDDVDEDDNDDDDDENYLQKFDESLKKNIISDWHPEDQVHNDEEVETMCTIVRDSQGFIIDPLHKTLSFITKYEKARILGERAKQLDAGAKAFITLKDNIIDSYLIALKEFEAKKIPFIIRRPLPNGACEYWRLRDLEFLE